MPPSVDSLPVVLFLADMVIMLGLGGRLLVAALRTRRAAEAAIGTAAAFGAWGVILVLVAPAAFPVWFAFFPPAFYRRLLRSRAIGADS